MGQVPSADKGVPTHSGIRHMCGTSFEILPRFGQRRRSESVGTCGRAVQIAHGAMFLGWEAGIPLGPLVVLDYQR